MSSCACCASSVPAARPSTRSSFDGAGRSCRSPCPRGRPRTIARPSPAGGSSFGVELQPASCSDRRQQGRGSAARQIGRYGHREGWRAVRRAPDYREPDLNRRRRRRRATTAPPSRWRPPSRPARAAVARRACTASGWTRRWWRWRPSSRAATCSTSIAARARARSTAQRRRTASRRVRAGQRLDARTGADRREPRLHAAGRWRWRVLYEDEHLLVIDKPAGLVVHPAPGNWSGTLLNGLLAHHAGGGRAAARRHRAPAGQGHLGPDGGRQDAAGDDRAGARHRGARRAPPVPGAGARRHRAEARSAVDAPIGRDPRSRVRMAVVRRRPAGARHAPTCSGWSRHARRLRRRQRAALHAAHRAHAPDPRAPGASRAPAGGRRAVRRPAGAGPGAAGAARRASCAARTR